MLNEFEMHCDQAHLELNVLKTKELIVDFRKNRPVSEVSIIHGANVEIVTSYKYLGTIVDDKLKFTENAQAIVKKGQQRLYFLRKLKSFSVDNSIISLFYKSFILFFCPFLLFVGFVISMSRTKMPWRELFEYLQR